MPTSDNRWDTVPHALPHTRTSLIRTTIANIGAAELAAEIQRRDLSATVFPSFGAGEWGVEPGATMETVGLRSLMTRVIQDILRERHEACAYVTINSAEAYLLYADGTERTL